MRKRSGSVAVVIASGTFAGLLWASQGFADLVQWPYDSTASIPAGLLATAAMGDEKKVALQSTSAHRPFWTRITAWSTAQPIERMRSRTSVALSSLPSWSLKQRAYSMSAPEFLSDPAAAQAHSLAVGDVSGDGRDDLVFLYLRHAPNPINNRTEIYVAYQLSDGRLDAAVRIADSGNNLSHQLLVADLDRDGVGDIITATVNGVMTLRSHADGTFTSNTIVVGDPYDIVVTDVDRDDYLDVLVDSSDTLATVIHGDGHGAFDRVSTLPLPSAAARTTGDVTGDGLDDLILGTIFNRPLEEFRIYPALASGGYDTPVLRSLPLGSNHTSSLVVGDFNGDGRGDLVLDEARNEANLRLYIQDAQGNLASSVEITRYSSSGPMIAVDLDRDGRTDLAKAHTGWSYIGYYLQNSEGLAPETLINAYQSMGRLYYFAAGDLNHDGCVDLAIARGSQSPVFVYGQGCAPPRVAACCSRSIAMEDSVARVASQTSPLARPDSGARANDRENPIRNTGPRPVRDERGTRDVPRKRVYIPVLNP